MSEIYIKRVYDPYEQKDGCRILVDRLWPRGLSKEKAQLTCWAKDLAPSNELRKWYGHELERYEEFRIKYIGELRNEKLKSSKLDQLCHLALKQDITLLYAAKDPSYNNAFVLKEELIRNLNNKI